MNNTSCIELKQLHLPTRIGSYGPSQTVPEYHSLDLMLWIHSSLVLIDQDDMSKVFDYDPLIESILEVAKQTHFETQERLMTLIVQLCASYTQIESLEMSLSKYPVKAGSGHLGVRLSLNQEALRALRKR
jgi:dihydroneopterin aldolase